MANEGLTAAEEDEAGAQDFDNDPAALAWARAHVEEFIRRMGVFENRAAEKGDPITRLGCGVTKMMAEQHFLGTEKIIGVFDERRIGAEDTDG